MAEIGLDGAYPGGPIIAGLVQEGSCLVASVN